MHTFILTGGHHNSALVVAKELVKRGHHVVWVGHRHSSRGDTQDSAEYLEVKAARIPFHDLVAARLLPSLVELVRAPLGIIQAIKVLNTTRPTAILSFGGYIGGTVAIAGKLLGIPIFLHEQTVTAGRSNKLIGYLSKKIYLTWEQSARYFPSKKTLVVGLPLRDSILNSKVVALFSRKKPTLLVMGGKQGAHAINQFIFRHLAELLNHYNLVHQTGTNSTTQDYDRALALQSTLGSLSDSYLPMGYITESEIGRYLKGANIYFGRSGAHICYELGLLGIKSILTPLMSTHDHEQHKNALILKGAKLALILPESKLSYDSFVDLTSKLSELKGKPLPLPRHASSTLVDHLLSELG